MPLLWTQGLRPDEPGVTHPMSKHEVLWRRLTGRFRALHTGDTTRDSEDRLGIGRHTYFYMGYTDPEFGTQVSVFDNHEPPGEFHTRVSPFDTGGIAQAKIPLTRRLRRPGRARLVAGNSFEVGVYQDRYEAWAATAFTSRRDYVNGIPPHTPFSSDVDLSVADDDRAWRWEGRVTARDFAAAPVRPIAVFFAEPGRLAYTNWVTWESPTSAEEADEHLALIDRIGFDVEDPEQAARELIEGALP